MSGVRERTLSVPSARSLASRAAYEVMTMTSRFPRLALAKGEVVLAWTETEKESSRVKTARIRVPN